MKPLTYTDTPDASSHPGMTFRMFVLFVATIMAMNAISIDSMLPALPEIGRTLGIAEANDTQWVITAYLLGFGGAQIIYGPLADRFGRKPILLAGIAIYAAGSLWAAFTTSLEAMMFARVVQGIGAAATRVLAVTIVRDCYSGATMARVMSLTFIVFLAAPIIAPSLGQLVMLFVSWHWIFGLLAIYGVWAFVWGARKLPETLHEKDRMPLSVGAVGHALWLTLTTRVTIFYTLAVTLIFGALFGFINSIQQVFEQTFNAADIFPAIFAGIAAFMALSSFVNSRVVERLGTRLVSHTALIGFTGFAAIHMISAYFGHESIWSFSLVQGGQMFCFGLIVSNFNSMAMEPMGHIAGTASSVQGFISTTGGALLGFLVGQQFDGTTLPLGTGFFVFAALAIVCVLLAERGRMFRRVSRPSPGPQAQ
jgi:DHA1 family bicyclomycin/chloramphenicol resistance-like MFS transporter